MGHAVLGCLKHIFQLSVIVPAGNDNSPGTQIPDHLRHSGQLGRDCHFADDIGILKNPLVSIVRSQEDIQRMRSLVSGCDIRTLNVDP